MKIAMMVRGYIPAPTPSDMIYAPIDLAVQVAQGLTKRGHKVSFFGPLGTHIQGVDVKTLRLPPLVREQKEFSELVHDIAKQMHYIPGLWDAKLANAMFERATKKEYDLLYFAHPETALPLACNNPKVPVAYTLHDPISDLSREVFDMYQSQNQHFISISNNQRRDGPDLNYCDTIYNGIDLDKYTFFEDHEDYLMIAGRIVPDKGFKEAIEIAQATDHRLLIIGPVYDDHKDYFDRHIKPHLNDKILYLGFMEKEQLIKYYQKAKAFVLPLQWEEPFGLVMVEAMACGTPVIVLRRGSAQEVVVDKKTGFVCDHTQDMIDAVGKVDEIDRKACRKHVEDNFSIDRMVDNYEAAFRSLIDKRKQPTKKTKTSTKQFKDKVKKLIKDATKT